MELQEGHQEAVTDTQSNDKKLKTKREARNKLKLIIKFLENNYPDYYDAGVVEITDEQKNDREFFAHTNTHDLVYTGINVRMIKACLATLKVKENGKLRSFKDLSKFHGAIKFGSEKANQPLPPEYYSQMDRFLAAYKKETRKAAQDGNLDEEESDPVPYPLYCNFCEWSISAGNVFLWAYTVSQWNCIARSVSIDPLGLHNFTPGAGGDSIKCTYDLSKSDQEGKKVSPKNIYANPFDPRVSWNLAMGCWICISQDSFADTERIFLNEGANEGSASSRYCSQLGELLKDKVDVVREFLRPDHCNPHGNRKGAATHITTATTCPAPIPSVAARGEWSIGQVLDLYWQFGDPGDCYAGRSLAGLDPDSPSFAALPPHFVQGMENEYIKEAMELCFGTVLEFHPDTTWMLLRLLASMVHEREYLNHVRAIVPNHPFTGIPILTRPNLLGELAKLVTMNPSEKIPRATGIPPHVNQLRMLRNLLDVCGKTFEQVGSLFDTLRDAAKEAIETAALQSGQITTTHLNEKISEIKEYFDQQIEELKRLGMVQAQGASGASGAATTDMNSSGCYEYDGKEWDVPEGFTLPANMKRRAAWNLWLYGDPGRMSAVNGEMKNTPIKPFRLLKPSKLPKEVASSYRSSWRPILNLMTSAPGMNIPSNISELTADTCNQLYDVGTNHIRSVASYIFESGEPNWSLSTWSLRVRRASINKRGNDEDRRHLLPPTRHNRPHTGPRKRRRRNTRPGLASRSRNEQDEASETLRSMLTNLNPEAEARVSEQVAG